MNYVCQVCGEATDDLGFKVRAHDGAEAARPLTCIACRLAALRVKAAPSRREPLTDRFADDMPNLPYKDL